MKKGNILIMLLAVVMIASYGGMRAKAASNLRYDADDVHDGTVGLWYIADIYYYAFSDGIKTAKVSSGSLPDGLSCKFENGLGLKDESSIVRISGTPTKAGTYSFQITVTSAGGKTITSPQYKVTICSSGQTFKLTLTGCTAEADGKTGTYFRAGEDITLNPKNLEESEYVYSWKNDGGLSIYTGSVMDYSVGLRNSFTMPAKNVSIECVKKSKDRGTYTHNAAATGPDNTCDRIHVASLGRGNLSVVKVKEEEKIDETMYRILYYSYLDLDKDGTTDLEVMENTSLRVGAPVGGEVCYIKAVEGRSVYGTWTVEIPKKDIYKYSECDALYSKIVLNMGTKNSDCPKSSSGHKIQGIQAKAPTCTKDGYRWHWECTECGEWFADAEGKTKVTNKSLYTLKAMGHKWSAWYVAKEATETEEGIRERVCYNNRNHKEQETIPKLPPAPTEPPTTEAPTEPPTTEAPTTEAPTEPETTEAPTTEAPTEPETTEAPTAEAPTEPATTEAPTTEAPTQAPTEAPKPTDPETPARNGGSNTILYVLLGVMAVVSGLLGGILIGKRNKGKDSK